LARAWCTSRDESTTSGSWHIASFRRDAEFGRYWWSRDWCGAALRSSTADATHPECDAEQFAANSHVEGVVREPADVALDDHDVLGALIRGLGINGAIAHPDLMHAQSLAGHRTAD
jgi:hypothetical protein